MQGRIAVLGSGGEREDNRLSIRSKKESAIEDQTPRIEAAPDQRILTLTRWNRLMKLLCDSFVRFVYSVVVDCDCFLVCSSVLRWPKVAGSP